MYTFDKHLFRMWTLGKMLNPHLGCILASQKSFFRRNLEKLWSCMLTVLHLIGSPPPVWYHWQNRHYWMPPSWMTCTKDWGIGCPLLRAVAYLSPLGVQEKNTFSIFPCFPIFFLIFPWFSSLFWSSGWVACPPGKVLATPLPLLTLSKDSFIELKGH